MKTERNGSLKKYSNNIIKGLLKYSIMKKKKKKSTSRNRNWCELFLNCTGDGINSKPDPKLDYLLYSPSHSWIIKKVKSVAYSKDCFISL